jgi:hypothetical protein
VRLATADQLNKSGRGGVPISLDVQRTPLVEREGERAGLRMILVARTRLG